MPRPKGSKNKAKTSSIATCHQPPNFLLIPHFQFSPIKTQKKQPKPLFHFIVFPSGFDVFAVFMGGEDEDSEVWMRSSV